MANKNTRFFNKMYYRSCRRIGEKFIKYHKGLIWNPDRDMVSYCSIEAGSELHKMLSEYVLLEIDEEIEKLIKEKLGE